MRKNSGQAANCEIFKNYLQKQADLINSTLTRVQAIKKFVILEEEFSFEGDELTPTMKFKRRIIHEKYKNEIESMYIFGNPHLSSCF